MCEKLIYEVKRLHNTLDKEQIFKEQTALINKINKSLSKKVFANFVPNYKDLATISQILNPDVSIKHRILLENTLAKSLSSPTLEVKAPLAPIDNLVYKTFVKKFNEQYNGKLLEVQEVLLSKYIASFHDNGTEFRAFLNEELSRLKKNVRESLADEQILKDQVLYENAKQVLSLLDSYKEVELDAPMIEQVLKIQSLVEELNT